MKVFDHYGGEVLKGVSNMKITGGDECRNDVPRIANKTMVVVMFKKKDRYQDGKLWPVTYANR